jgi:hypothetical protein
MEHDICDNMKDHLSTTEQVVSPSYDKTMRCDRFLHILRFPCSSKSDNVFYGKNRNYDRLWKLQRVVNLLNSAVKIMCPFWTSGCGVNQKHKHFGINIYKLCNISGYICLLMEEQEMCDHRWQSASNYKSADKKVGRTWVYAMYG